MASPTQAQAHKPAARAGTGSEGVRPPQEPLDDGREAAAVVVPDPLSAGHELKRRMADDEICSEADEKDQAVDQEEMYYSLSC